MMCTLFSHTATVAAAVVCISMPKQKQAAATKAASGIKGYVCVLSYAHL
jgi:hypothetical protein